MNTETLADRLRRHRWLLVITSLLAIGVLAAIVYPLELSRLWLIAGAIAIAAIQVTVVAIYGRPSAAERVGAEPSPEPAPASSGPQAFA